MTIMIMCNNCGEWQKMEKEIGVMFPEVKCSNCGLNRWDWQSTTSDRTFDISRGKSRSRKIKKKK